MLDKFLQKKIEKLEKRNEAFFAMSRLRRSIRHPVAFFYLGFLRRTLSFLVSVGMFPSLIEATTFFGDKLRVVMPSDFLIYWWGFYGEYEFSLSKFLLKNLKEGDIFIDGGAHVGYFSLLASRMVGSRGQVHAFEPTPSVFDILKYNAAEKGNITINNCALWKKKDIINFNDFGLKEGAINNVLSIRDLEIKSPLKEIVKMDFQSYKIAAITLDDYCRDNNVKPSFIKLDTEGSEADILVGAHRIIKESRPLICLEVWESSFRTGVWKQIVDFMAILHYGSFWLTKEGEIVNTSQGFINSSIAVFIPMEKT